jgi:hypothetical protein
MSAPQRSCYVWKGFTLDELLVDSACILEPLDAQTQKFKDIIPKVVQN